jgi:hypothetical protein
MVTILKAVHYGQLVANKFTHDANGGAFRELRLFRALREAILSTKPRYPVEEFHGARSQVIFSACAPWTKSIARCELSDLCIVWFRKYPRPIARITFMQAKRSQHSHSPCIYTGASINENFDGDSTQWYLLHNRPSLMGRFTTFKPPANLLSDALLPSVASYCVFHERATRDYSFFYASADVITASTPTKAGNVQLNASASTPTAFISGFTEQKWACCPRIFGSALFSGLIGSPIHLDGTISSADAAWRSSVRGWLGSILAGAIRNQQVGPVIQAFATTFEVPIAEVTTAAPSRTLLFIQGDEEEAAK